jgi:chemotaxis protein CheZ
VQHRVFRVEQMSGTGQAQAPAAARVVSAFKAAPARSAAGVTNLERSLALIQDAIARNKRELTALLADGKERRMARAAGELGAAVDAMEKATDKILKSTETIDESAKTLTASLRDDFKRGLAQEIQDHVVQIYEACNFQDLAGQRIGNVIATLTMIEDQVAGMIERCGQVGARGSATGTHAPAARGLLNGPRLDGDSGHASQRDIDKIFDWHGVLSKPAF